MANRAELSSNWRTSRPISSLPDNNNKRNSEQTHSYNTKIETIRGENDPETFKAIEEGRRLYVGNLPSMAKPEDITQFFSNNRYQMWVSQYSALYRDVLIPFILIRIADQGASREHINMSIDPYTGRNPSYCFVELGDRAQAYRATQELSGQDLLGRPVKLGPGIARSTERKSRGNMRNQQHPEEPVFQRWTRTDASNHWQGYTEEGRRLWVGGLPRMAGHAAVNAGIREIFDGFHIEAVSKVIIPKEPEFGHAKAYNHRYLFVDFESAEEARQAAKAIDGRYAWGVQIRVRVAQMSDSRKAHERENWNDEPNKS
ncbi:uncharacterized protein KY384_000311 [Bacidia gigantensis]|uniref:uncharacterized protein n=1 Tax=Bacidia gigantensis TaxID=2732470 RepID=UPI001D03FC1D|nr:uncharacterized protein KY384_000311 [Bacidia gigantensis]KAG8526318.1 hypothetical protein KY384_000311 [Bacidia gigantensis]